MTSSKPRGCWFNLVLRQRGVPPSSGSRISTAHRINIDFSPFAQPDALVNAEDFRLQRLIEALLVRNYVETRKLDVQVISGNVYLDGFFEVASNKTVSRGDEPQELIESHHEARRTLLHVEQQIRAMGEVNGLYFNLKNWARTGGGWVPSKAY